MTLFRSRQCLALADFIDDFDQNFAVQVWARRLTGAGVIYFDGLCPMPAAEGFLHVKRINLIQANSERVIFSESPAGRRQMQAANASAFVNFADFEADAFRLPVGDGRMIVAYESSVGPTLANRIGLCTSGTTYKYYPRWRSLRGAE